MRHILIITILYIITSCSSIPPTKYYILNPKIASSKIDKYQNKTITISFPTSTKELLGRDIIYSYSDIEMDKYNNSKWSSSLYKLLNDNISKSMSSIFKNIIDYHSSANSDYILESRVYDFYHKVRDNLSISVISIEFHLIDTSSDKVIKSHKFNYQIPTVSKDAKGYVQATNIAMERLLIDLVIWLRKGEIR